MLIKAISKQSGFTLVEVIVTVAIIGILLAIALPSYQQYVKQGRRAEAQQYMFQQAGLLERNYTRLGRYPTEKEVTFKQSDYYSFTYTPDGNTKFSLVAVPIGDQADDECGSLSLDHKGVTSASNAECWY